MLRRLAPSIVILVLLSLVAAACVVRTRPPQHRGQAIQVRDDDHGKHKKHKPKKHKDKDHDD